MMLRGEWRLALEVPRWAWRFYRRHWMVIVGLSLIPSLQRLVVVNWGLPPTLSAISEVVVMAVRLLLLVVIWRLATPPGRPRWGTFAKEHWPSLIIQAGLLLVAALIFNNGLEDVVGGLLPEGAQQTYLAVLLFVKNPTIIALTFVWVVGMIRQLLRQPSVTTGGSWHLPGQVVTRIVVGAARVGRRDACGAVAELFSRGHERLQWPGTVSRGCGPC